MVITDWIHLWHSLDEAADGGDIAFVGWNSSESNDKVKVSSKRKDKLLSGILQLRAHLRGSTQTFFLCSSSGGGVVVVGAWIGGGLYTSCAY